MTDAATGTRPRRRTVVALITFASLLAFLATFSVWANRQALETDTWTDTSSELLEDEDIRTAIAGFLVDSLYDNVDVAAELEERLPPQAQALAQPAAGALRALVERAAPEALARPRVQELWEEANRRAHERLLDVIEGNGEFVSEEGDVATLDLGALVTELSQRTGVGGRLVEQLPEDAAQITIVRGDQIEFAQTVVDLLRDLAIVLTALALGLYALAVYLAAGWRREALRSVGIGFAVVGLAVLVTRGLAGNAVVGALTSTAAVEPAADSTWEIGTSLLRASAVGLIGYGLLIVLGAWLAGPSQAATGLRRGLAPYLRDRRIAYAAVGVIVLLVLWWNPTPGTSRLAPTLLLIALFIAGVEALRALTVSEFPDAPRGQLLPALRQVMPFRRKPTDSEMPPPGSEDARLAALERLARLHQAGVLDDEELSREKSRVLAGS
jgi:GNAT superfamily N-acetyltransferase